MRLYLVVDETRFYHPGFVADLLRNTPDEVVGAALVTEVPEKSDLERYLRRNWPYLRPQEALVLAFRKYSSALREKFTRRKRGTEYHSVRAVLEEFGVDYVEVKRNVNEPRYLAHIRSKDPDVIVSSNSLIFGSEILSIPKICSINRHSALLPKYGGLWPVFHAYRSGETHTGVSAHTMEKKIDQGVVLARKEVEIRRGASLSDLYEKCFRESADVVLTALEKIRNNDLTSCTESREASYFSFPTREHWREFRKRGGRFV